MTTTKKLLGIAVALVILGIASFALQNVLDPSPDPECTASNQPNSGFVDEDDPNCAITQESWEAISDWNSKPKLFRILGLALILGGIGTGVASIVVGRRTKAPQKAPPTRT